MPTQTIAVKLPVLAVRKTALMRLSRATRTLRGAGGGASAAAGLVGRVARARTMRVLLVFLSVPVHGLSTLGGIVRVTVSV